MSDQADFWGRAAEGYEQEFIDPDRPGARNPLREAVAVLAAPERTAADLGCGVGPLPPFLAERFGHVVAVDFAEGMLARARERCRGLANVELLRRDLTDLAPLAGRVQVAGAAHTPAAP